MDHLLINESSFSAANLSSYSLADIWPLKEEASNNCGLGLGVVSLGGSENGGRSVEASTVTEQNSGRRKRKEVTADVEEEDGSSRMGSATGGNNSSKLSNKHAKVRRTRDKNCTSKPDVRTVRAAAPSKLSDQTTRPSEPPKDYIHVRARRGQATDSHSLAERARREKISERMKLLQEIVPGCSKVIGKALILDEIINYIQSLQNQVEFLSMKLEAVTSRMNMSSTVDGFHPKDLFDVAGMMFGAREYAAAPEPEPQWLHIQIGNNFEQPK